MRPFHVLRLGWFLLVVVACGCSSNNKGKIEDTKWASEAVYSSKAFGQPATLAPGAVFFHFRRDGKLVGRIGTRNFTGTYTLGWGDQVTFHLDQEFMRRNKHTETVVINGNHMTMSDPNGTQLKFRKWP
jgi:hypothetical protein